MTQIESKSAVQAMKNGRKMTREYAREKQSAFQVLTASYHGKDRKPYKNGGRYNIIVHRCAGHRFHNGTWMPDTRVQVYLETFHPGRDSGHIMYPSMEDLQKDFAI